MLQNWLSPLSTGLIKQNAALDTALFGKKVVQHTADEMPSLKKTRIAIIGVGEKEANDIRYHLYRMAYAFPESEIADLGNLRKAEPSVLQPVLYELMAGKVLPVVLCSSDALARGQFMAFQETGRLVNMVVVDEQLRLAGTYDTLLKPRHGLLFHFGHIGMQVHQTQPEVFDFFAKNNFDLVRMGKSRAALEETEPIIRDADTLAFHLAAIKGCEAPGVANISPSGFMTEEACQICRYAGMSDKLLSFGIYGFQGDKDREGQTAQVAAQMTWYFLEGFFARKGDYPMSTTGLTEYIVAFRKQNYQITFWKSTKSGRWWMQVPVNTKRKHERHRLIPCSYQDYQAACREELPERLLQAMGRF
jgi:formiminoglutamase